MTKEKLKKEAEQLYENWYAHKLGAISIIDVICKMAEPREKQIQIDAEQIRALQKQNGELTDKVRELKQQIEKMKNCKNCANYMISGKCPSFFRTGWCKNWEMTRSKK